MKLAPLEQLQVAFLDSGSGALAVKRFALEIQRKVEWFFGIGASVLDA